MDERRVEYAVEQKKEGKNRLLRLLLILLYVFFTVGSFVVICWIGIVPVFAIIPLLLYILVWFTWRRVQVTHEYVIEVGEMTFSEIYGNRTRREVVRVPVKQIEKVWSREDRAEPDDADLVYDFLGSASTPDAYFLTYKDEEERYCVIRFEATAKALRLLALHNPSAVTCTRHTRY